MRGWAPRGAPPGSEVVPRRESGGGRGPPPPPPREIKIGAVIPRTGRSAAGGALIKGGYEIAQDDINAAGGVEVKQFKKKIPIKINFLDDASDPTQTVSRLEQHYAAGVL